MEYADGGDLNKAIKEQQSEIDELRRKVNE